MIHAILDILSELAPWLFLGAAASAVLHLLVPSTWLRRQLSGPSGVAKAVGPGRADAAVLLRGHPRGHRPEARRGEHRIGHRVLVSTPQTGVDSVLVTASMLGWPFALYKLVAAAITGLVAGGLADRVDRAPPDRRVATERPIGGRRWPHRWPTPSMCCAPSGAGCSSG